MAYENIDHDRFFTGMIPPQQVPNYYQAGDIFVSASTSETQGLTYMEAMASALPLLCRADECLDGVIQDGVNRLIYRNEQEFLERLHQLKTDFAFRNQLGILARQSVENRYSIPAFAAACLKVYRSLGLICHFPRGRAAHSERSVQRVVLPGADHQFRRQQSPEKGACAAGSDPRYP